MTNETKQHRDHETVKGGEMTASESIGLAIVVAAALWLIWKSGGDKPDPKVAEDLNRQVARIQAIEDWQKGDEINDSKLDKRITAIESKIDEVAEDLEILTTRIEGTESKASAASDLAHKTLIDQSRPQHVVLSGAVSLIEPKSTGPAQKKGSFPAPKKERGVTASHDKRGAHLKNESVPPPTPENRRAARSRSNERARTMEQLNKRMKVFEK